MVIVVSTSVKIDYSIKVSSRVLDCLNPDCICIPIDRDTRIIAKDKEYIYKNTLVAEDKNGKIFSSISGNCLGIKEIIGRNYLVIKNDYKEKILKNTGNKSDISKYSKEKVIELVDDLANNDLIKITKDELNTGTVNTLIINGMDKEPYSVSNIFLLKKYLDEELETIDAISEIFGIDETFLVIKNNDKDLINDLIDHIGTYPSIKLKIISDIYPIKHPSLIAKTVINIKRNDYIVIDVKDIYTYYEILKKKKPKTESLVTITGNGIEDPKVINIKLYSPIKPFIEEHFKLKKGDYHYIENGLISGKEVDITSYIINPETEMLLYSEIVSHKNNKCINCGACMEVCPMKLNPSKKDDKNLCIRCNLCSYVCPSHINLLEKRDKNL